MDFETIFGKSYSDYKKNFRVIFILTLILVGIPLVLSNLILLWFSVQDPVFYEMLIAEDPENISVKFAMILSLLSFITLALYFIFEAGLVKDSIKGKFKLNKTINSGKKYFWKFVWFSIVIFSFLILLFLALIIPGIIFAVYWTLAVYIYLDSKKTVVQSLSASYHMVRGNWWRIFGYTILVVLLLGVIGLILDLFTVPMALYIESLASPSLVIVFINFLIEDIVNFFNILISAPFVVLFYKNIYLRLRKEKRGVGRGVSGGDKVGKGKKGGKEKKR
jgi:hypothetical protein